MDQRDLPDVIVRHVAEGRRQVGIHNDQPILYTYTIEEAVIMAWQELGPGWTIRDVAYAIATDGDRTVIHREALVTFARLTPPGPPPASGSSP